MLISQGLLKKAGWIVDSQAQECWLLVGSPGRCRLLSGNEVDTDPNLRSLQASIDSEVKTPNSNALEFRDDTLLALGLRLLRIEITPPGPGWRITLPKPLAAIMQIRPKESEVALLFIQGHIEIWNMENLRKSVTTPLTEIVWTTADSE